MLDRSAPLDMLGLSPRPVLLLGRRGEAMLPRRPEWMNAHSWRASEVVIALFLLTAIESIACVQPTPSPAAVVVS